MLIKRGMIEILQMADGGGTKHFVDFTKILIKKRRLSSSTVSKRLGELLTAGAISEVIARSDSGRRIIAYTTTDKGRNVVANAEQLEEALTRSKVK
jgi:DNA-binding MarR family transcriptional regulator